MRESFYLKFNPSRSVILTILFFIMLAPQGEALNMDMRKPKILVVEDNFMSKTLVREILEMNDYEVLEADRGTDALRIATIEKPDLILMDINLPGMDGVTAARVIKSNADGKNIPILALTASAMKGDEEKIIAQGFDGYIAKPVEMKELLKKLSDNLPVVT